MALNAAPIANCDSAEAGIEVLNAQAKLQGFATIIKGSKKDKQAPATVRKPWLICDRGRHYIPDPRSRRTASKKTDCPFKATCTAFLVATRCIGNYTEGLDVIHEHWLFNVLIGTPPTYRSILYYLYKTQQLFSVASVVLKTLLTPAGLISQPVESHQDLRQLATILVT